jgi:hypothetical protein
MGVLNEKRCKTMISGGFERESDALRRDEGCFAALNPGFPSSIKHFAEKELKESINYIFVPL